MQRTRKRQRGSKPLLRRSSATDASGQPVWSVSLYTVYFLFVFSYLGVYRYTGGESGIRTHGTLSRTHAFQACALSRSAISPARVALNSSPSRQGKPQRRPRHRRRPPRPSSGTQFTRGPRLRHQPTPPATPAIPATRPAYAARRSPSGAPRYTAPSCRSSHRLRSSPPP